MPPSRTLARTLVLGVLLLVVASCSGSDDDAATTTTAAPTTTTTRPPTTTTTAPAADLVFPPDLAPEVAAPVTALYTWLAGGGAAPELPAGLAAHLAGVEAGPVAVEFAATARPVSPQESVAVLEQTGTDDADTVLLIDDGTGWRIVGAKLPSFGRTAWYGEPVRTVLVLGSDAQWGEDQTRLRADSVHIVTSVPAEHAGAIVGFPRDSWVSSPYGRMKLNGVMADRGPDAMVETIEPLTGIELDGYFVTGFTGFVQMVTNFGGLTVDLPNAIRSGVDFQANYPAGEQHLDGDRLLWLARIRKTLANGDFGRSENHGLIMTFALEEVRRRGILELPDHVANILGTVWTDLPTEDVLTLGATAFEVEPAMVVNRVLPGSAGTAGSASVVYLSPAAEDVYRDLDDGLLDN